MNAQCVRMVVNANSCSCCIHTPLEIIGDLIRSSAIRTGTRDSYIMTRIQLIFLVNLSGRSDARINFFFLFEYYSLSMYSVAPFHRLQLKIITWS